MRANYQKAISSCFAVAVMFFYSLVQLFSFNGLSEHLSSIFSPSVLGVISSLFLVGVMFSLIPAGILLERCNMRRLFLWTMSINVTSQFILCFSDNVNLIAINRLIAGLTNAVIFLGTLSTIKLWAEKHITLATGMVFTLAKLSGIFGSTVLVFVYLSFHWFASMASITMVGILALITLLICFYEPYRPPIKKEDMSLSIIRKISIILATPINWVYACLIGIYYLPGYVLHSLWGNLFYSQKYFLSSMDASYITSVSFVGALAGYFLFGVLEEKLQSKYLMLVLTTLCIFGLQVALGSNYIFSFTALCSICFIYNVLIAGGQILCFGAINEHFPLYLSNIGNALIAFAINLFGIAGTPIFGALLELNWDGHMQNNIPRFALSDLNLAINMLGLMFFLAIFMSVIVYVAQSKLKINKDMEQFKLS